MNSYHNFKVGDKVKVLYINEFSRINFKEMVESVGKILTVKAIYSAVQLDNMYWYQREWLQPIKNTHNNYSTISEMLATL